MGSFPIDFFHASLFGQILLDFTSSGEGGGWTPLFYFTVCGRSCILISNSKGRADTPISAANGLKVHTFLAMWWGTSDTLVSDVNFLSSFACCFTFVGSGKALLQVNAWKKLSFEQTFLKVHLQKSVYFFVGAAVHCILDSDSWERFNLWLSPFLLVTDRNQQRLTIEYEQNTIFKSKTWLSPPPISERTGPEGESMWNKRQGTTAFFSILKFADP